MEGEFSGFGSIPMSGLKLGNLVQERYGHLSLSWSSWSKPYELDWEIIQIELKSKARDKFSFHILHHFKGEVLGGRRLGFLIRGHFC